MSTGTYLAYSGAEANIVQMEVIANNIANASTVGYRRDRTTFDTVMAAAMPFVSQSPGIIDLTPGTLQQTGNPLDAALSDDHFFVVRTADGNELYTRRGDFQIDPQGQLVIPGGQTIVGASGALNVPAGAEVRLREDGSLIVDGQAAGRLRIVRFENPAELEKVGESLISAGADAGLDDVDQPKIAVGFLEQSNVNLAAELVAMIQNQRTFEAAMKSMQMSDELTERLVTVARS